MKRHAIPVLLAAVLVLGTIAFAAGGTSENPLISLSYLTGLFTQGLTDTISEKGDSQGSPIYEDALAQAQQAAAESGLNLSYAGRMTEAYLKEGDVLTGVTGCSVLPLSGSLSVTFSSGAVIDISQGAEISSGSSLSSNHRYLVAEGTAAKFTVTSQTAVVQYEGYYGLSRSSKPDYPAMADALKQLRLFRGSDVGYGNGYELERQTNRLEALVLFIRVLGEEEAALSCTGTHPFQDVPAWGSSYVAYAYQKGYTDGYGGGKFGSYDPVSAVMYAEFLLRAMGYSSTSQPDWTTALERSVDAGLITSAELTFYQNNPFLRAQVVYMSFFALDTPVSGSSATLGEKLVDSGCFTAKQYETALAAVSGRPIV